MKRQWIEMTKSEKGADTGGTVKEYEAGTKHFVTDDLANCFFSTKSAKTCEPGTDEEAKPAAKKSAPPKVVKK